MYAPIYIYIYIYISPSKLKFCNIFFLCVVEPTVVGTYFSEAKSSEPTMKRKKYGKCRSTPG